MKHFYLPLLLIFLLTGTLEVVAQEMTVRGKVTGYESNESLPGVNIIIKGTSTGTVTDIDGNYSITVHDPSAILVFSYIGFVQEEVAVNGQSTVNLAMVPDITSLDELVVIAYGTARKEDLTGAVEQVKMQEMQAAPVKSFDEALGGRVAGLTVSSNDGQPGSNNNMVIRGIGSITGSTAPLYVIDGFPMEESYSNTLSPGDIESITVLKDASAAAIYGSRGANGVIIITTKRGKKGPAQVSYNAYVGVSENPKPLELMDAYEFVKYQNDLDPIFTEKVYLAGDRTLDYYKDAETIDYQDQMYQSAFTHSHELSIRGGTDKTVYSISGNLLDQNGIGINSGFKRYQGRLTLDQEISDKVKVGADLTYSSERTNGTIVKDTEGEFTYASFSLLYSVWGYPPTKSIHDEGRDEIYNPAIPEDDHRVNPILSAKNSVMETNVKNFRANTYLEWEIIPDLKLKVAGGITDVMIERRNFFNSKTTRGNDRRPFKQNGSIYFTPITAWNNTNTLTYNKTFNKVHSLNVLAGMSFNSHKNGTYGFEAIHVENEGTGIDGLDEASNNQGQSGRSMWTLNSYFGRLNYQYDSRYLFTGSIRYDGSSKFARGRRWGLFPSGAFAWRMSEESFMKDSEIVSNAKLRLSYGASGNNRISDFAYMSTMSIPIHGGYSFDNAAPKRGTLLQNYGNPFLKWETTVQANIGYDLGLFNNRIDLIVDVYRKNTKDVLLLANLPFSTGLTVNDRAQAYKNIGEIQNEGLEFTINTINISRNDFEWSTNFNISFNRNEVISLNEGQSALLQNVAFDNDFRNNTPYIAEVGQPIGQMYGLIWDGVYQYEDFDMVLGEYILKDEITTNGRPRSVIQPGDIKYKDINGDNIVNEMDYTVIGRGYPIHTGGFSNSFRYKGFDLNIFFQWSYGNDILNANKIFFEGNAKHIKALNQYATYENRWTPENPSNEYFRAGGKQDYFYTSRVVEDGSFLRLKTVSLGYNFNERFLNKLNLNTLRVYASAQNLYTWTNYSGSNPDVSTRHSALTPGFDFSSYPLARTLTVGLSTTF